VTKPNRKAFTLIELLVVVAIIALLIAILLPSLGRARKRANTSKCAANARSMGMSMNLYVADWQKFLPMTGATTDSWTQVLGGGKNGYGASAKLRLCPEAMEPRTNDVAQVPWFGTAHFAWGNSAETGPDPLTGKPLTASYGLNGHLYNASPLGQITALGGSAAQCYSVPVNRRESDIPVFVDATWRHLFPKPTDSPAPNQNIDDPGPHNFSGTLPISYAMIDRHDKAVNVSFLDGHAQTLKLKELYYLPWSRDWVNPTSVPNIPTK
jgi:prepilin-type N-terminal cleavage/methylation domain-containing protein/prepilin-type processing-associated H-X9-DG protein